MFSIKEATLEEQVRFNLISQLSSKVGGMQSQEETKSIVATVKELTAYILNTKEITQ
tara:strand:- start:291 stop:461 length:171 start_codon:yes stop_codon:yes gene_type:complete